MVKNNLLFERKFGFEVWDKGRINRAFSFAEDYRQFISECKTEREVAEWVVERAESEGYESITPFVPPLAGLRRGRQV